MTMKHDTAPLSSPRVMSLIATYEELYRIPEVERVTCYFGDYGGHFLKYGVAESAALAAYDNALAAVQMDSDTFLQSEDFIYRGGIIARMWNCMLCEDPHLQDALDLWAANQKTILLHEAAPGCCIPMEYLAKLTQSDQEDFADLLGAPVQEIRAGDIAIEVVISGVAPEELTRLSEAYDTFMEAEQAMGPTMG